MKLLINSKRVKFKSLTINILIIDIIDDLNYL